MSIFLQGTATLVQYLLAKLGIKLERVGNCLKLYTYYLTTPIINYSKFFIDLVVSKNNSYPNKLTEHI